MSLSVRCETCHRIGAAVLHFDAGESVQTVILPLGWAPVVRLPGEQHTHDAVSFQCGTCRDSDRQLAVLERT